MLTREIQYAISAVPIKRSSHYVKGVMIGAMSTMGIAFVVLLSFLWICLLSKKERAAKRYTEVKKQVYQEASKSNSFSNLSNCTFQSSKSFTLNRHQTYYIPWRSSIPVI